VIDFEEFDTSDPVSDVFAEDYFGIIAQEFGKAKIGNVGQATAHLFDAAELHAFGVGWMERHGR
jgi:hypothetical protein